MSEPCQQAAEKEELESKQRLKQSDGQGKQPEDDEEDELLAGVAAKVRRVGGRGNIGRDASSSRAAQADAAWDQMQSARIKKQDAKVEKKLKKAGDKKRKKNDVMTSVQQMAVDEDEDYAAVALASSKSKGKVASGSAVEPDALHVGKDGVKTRGLSEALEFDPMIQSLPSKGQVNGETEEREKHALDDFLRALAWARGNLPSPIEDDEFMQTQQFLVSLFLELAWTTRVCVNGKSFAVYSAFRHEAQRLLLPA